MSETVLSAFRSMVLHPENEWMATSDAARAEIENHIMIGPSCALPTPDDPAVIFGIVLTYGIGTVWMVKGKKFDTCWRSVARRQMDYCKVIFSALRLRRMQILIDAAAERNIRYAEFMGFRRESLSPHEGLGPQGENLLFYTWKGDK